MQIVDHFSCDAWREEIEVRLQLESEKRRSLPLFEIVKTFQQQMKEIQATLDASQSIDLAQKIEALSKEKIEYYQSSRFGWIKEFFSSLRNVFTLGIFKSSGQLGLELSQSLLQKAQKEQEEEVQEIYPEDDFELKEAEDVDLIYQLGNYFDAMHENAELEEDIEDSDQGYFGKAEEAGNSSLDDLATEKPSEDSETEKPKDKNSITLEAKQSDMPIILTPKEDMLRVFYSTWKYANFKQGNMIGLIGETIFTSAKIVKWELSSKNAKEHQLELKKEISATHPQVPGGIIILKQKMKIIFSEEQISGTQKHRQVIAFPDGGICYRMGIGWVSKDIPVKRILVELDSGDNVMCSIESSLVNLEKSADMILDFWQQAKWN